MSRGHNKGGKGHCRKFGEWKNVAKGREGKARETRVVNPLMCAPNLNDVGSAAYRRMQPVR